MEQDNNNDHLDRFLHRSFDNFSANPSDGLWDKINTDLSRDVPSGKVYPSFRTWQVAAVAALFSLFLLQHFYFQSKLEALRAEMQRTAIPDQELPTPTAAPAVSASAATPATIQRHQIITSPTTPVDPTSTPPVSTSENPKRPGIDNTRQHKAVKKQVAIEKVLTGSTLPTVVSNTPPLAIQIGDNQVVPKEKKDQGGREITQAISAAPLAIITGNMLPPSIAQTINAPEIKFIGLPFPTEIHQANHWIVNMHAMPGFISAKINLPDYGHMPFPGGNKIFSDQKQTGSTFLAGIGLEKELNKHWSVVSGIDYLKHSIQQTLPSPLQFKDRDHGPGGGGPDPGNPGEHDFNYYISTGAGTYAVDVELRAKDSTQSISEEEDINLELSTTHKISYLSLPVALKYRHTHRHWTTFIAAGIRANYLIQSNQELSEFTCKNDRFEFREQPRLEKKADDIRKISADLTISAGIAYRLGNLGVSLSPTFNSPVLKPIKDDHVSISSYWAGVSAGLQYYF